MPRRVVVSHIELGRLPTSGRRVIADSRGIVRLWQLRPPEGGLYQNPNRLAA